MLSDEAFEEAGATISDDVWSAEVVAKVARPPTRRSPSSATSTILVGFLGPLTNAPHDAGARRTRARRRSRWRRSRASRARSRWTRCRRSPTSRATSPSSSPRQHLGRFLPMMMTAAGTVPPARVLVLGAGVAGLQAIATARRLGAQVTGYDVRAAVAEQVQSLGAAFLELEAGKGAEGEGGYARELTDEEKAAQQAELADKIATFDVVITTALVPGRPRADPRHEALRREHEGGQRHRRPRRRVGRQLRADRAGRGRRQARRDDRLAAEPAGVDARARLGAVRAQRPVAARAARRRGRRAEPRTSTTRSSRAPASRATARSSTGAKKAVEAASGAKDAPKPRPTTSRPPSPRLRPRAQRRRASHGAAHRDRDPRAGRLRRLPGHLEGPEHAAHAAHVGHERDPRHRRARRPHRDRPRRRRSSPGSSSSSRSSSARSTSSAASSSPTAC